MAATLPLRCRPSWLRASAGWLRQPLRQPQRRPLGTAAPSPQTPPQTPPVQPPKRRAAPITWPMLGVSLVAGAGLVYYFQKERDKKNAQVAVQETVSVGKPKLGGPFQLVDQNGQVRTDADFRGRWMLVYFGFTFCPDICPEEISKMVEVVDSLGGRGWSPVSAFKTAAMSDVGDVVQPIFISVDPKRDTVAQVRAYVKEFSPKLIGLTGTPEQVAKAAKAYRVYFTISPMNSDDPSGDYLVDHSIFFYLMGPDGQLVDYYGQNRTAEDCTASIAKHVRDYRASEAKTGVAVVTRPALSPSAPQ